MKKFGIFIISLLIIFGSVKTVVAGECEINAAKQMSKILYTEVGGSYNSDASENFFGRLATASVILNHTTMSNHNTGTLYERIMRYTDTEYANYSTYRDSSFENVVSASRRGEMLYISALVLSGKFTFPKEIIYQAAESILKNDGAHEFTHSGNVYFGYGKNTVLSGVDVFGNSVSTDAQSYRNLAKSLEKTSYDEYNSNDVCSLVGNVSGSSGGSGNSPTPGGLHFSQSDPRLDYDSICSNEDIRSAFTIIGRLISVVKVIVPLLLIIFGMIDLGKAVPSSDENAIKKATSSLIKRFVAGVIVFFIPSIILVFMNWIEITNNITSESDENFGSCTKCLFDPSDSACQ